MAGNKNKNKCGCGTHVQNRSSLHIHWEDCPSLSLIPSVCLRQLVITKATHCCRGKPWGRTHREDGEAFVEEERTKKESDKPRREGDDIDRIGSCLPSHGGDDEHARR